MLETRLSVDLGSPATRVWEVTGSFNGLPDWHPWVDSSVLEPASGGVGRRVVIVGGASGRRELVERLVYYDATAREYAYAIVGGTAPPFVDYVGHLRVVPRGVDRCVFEFHARFNAAPGRTDTEARERIRSFYEAGLSNLPRLFGA
ncbi:mxaD protein [Burkholderiales bacterium]|nr:mxaD protein [Burkholderiales bacterium]